MEEDATDTTPRLIWRGVESATVRKWNERKARNRKNTGGRTLFEKLASQFGQSETNGLDLFLIFRTQV